jgi:hypothetical protein
MQAQGGSEPREQDQEHVRQRYPLEQARAGHENLAAGGAWLVPVVAGSFLGLTPATLEWAHRADPLAGYRTARAMHRGRNGLHFKLLAGPNARACGWGASQRGERAPFPGDSAGGMSVFSRARALANLRR